MDTVTAYFELLGTALPVMSASDEFHFLPRSHSAARHYSRLDDLSPDALQDLLRSVAEFHDRFADLALEAADLEARIDFETLKLSASGVLVAFRDMEVHRHDPLLWLKIGFIGLDHALNKPVVCRTQRADRVLARLRAFPRLLAQAARSLRTAPPGKVDAARSMVRDGTAYLQWIKTRHALTGTALDRALQDCRQALQRFVEDLTGLARLETTPVGLKTVLEHVLGSTRSPDEVYAIAEQDRQRHLEALDRLARSRTSRADWLEQYNAFQPDRFPGPDLTRVYQNEITELRRHFAALWPWADAADCPVVFAQTPHYLRSVRSSASFAAAFSTDPKETSSFYVTPGRISGRSGSDPGILDRRLLRKAPFLSAHETWPGHHLLDCTRRFLNNPVRSQVENPLFYEGWAYFTEGLLLENGYLEDPLWAIVHHRRSLWRAVRCMIDCGVAIGRLDRADSLQLLQEIGFSPGEAGVQVDRYALNPGYQICYTLGRHELQQLYDTFSGRLDLSSFCRLVVTGGEVPFHLLHERLERVAAQGALS